MDDRVSQGGVAVLLATALCLLLNTDPDIEAMCPPDGQTLWVGPPSKGYPPPCISWYCREINSGISCRVGTLGVNGRTFARINCPYHSVRGDSALKGVGQVVIPPVKKGEVLPIFGRLFEATDDSADTFEFKLVPPSKYPEGLRRVEKHSVVLFLTDEFECGTRFEAADLSLREISPVFGMHLKKVGGQVRLGKAEYVAHLAHPLWVEKEKGPPPAKVKAGDILIFPKPVNAGVLVLNVVPKDEKMKTVGWVEFAFETIPLDEVKKRAEAEQRAVVKFELPEEK